VASIDLATRRETRRIRVSREPVSIALSPDERHLLVANHLPAGPADTPPVAAVVDVIDTATGARLRPIALPNGSTTLRDIRIAPDGRYACVPHILARYFVPTTQLDRGWMNNNALSWIDLSSLTLLGTVLLDNIDRGAANPWALAWTADGSRLGVSHAGTHEVSVIDTAALLAKLGAASASGCASVATGRAPSSWPAAG
jgi:DNA-binding beta-propeller fold protein YncE